MTEEQADAILLFKNANEMSTAFFKEQGWGLEAFLRFAQLSPERAQQNLENLQAKIRESRSLLGTRDCLLRS